VSDQKYRIRKGENGFGLVVEIDGRRIKPQRADLAGALIYLDLANRPILQEKYGKYFPEVKTDRPFRQATFTKIIDDKEICGKSIPVHEAIKKGQLTQEDWDQEFKKLCKLQKSVYESYKEPGIIPNARLLLEKYRLPNKEWTPDFYRYYKDSASGKGYFIIIWGFVSENQQIPEDPPPTPHKKPPPSPPSPPPKKPPAWKKWLILALLALLLLGVAAFFLLRNAPPVITLKGNPYMTIVKGTPYKDPGADAKDDKDGDITSQIVISGDNFDSQLIGDHIIHYNVTDSNGEKAEEVVRRVEVTEKKDVPLSPEQPIISLIGAHYVTIIKGNPYTDQGASAMDPQDGDISSKIKTSGNAVDSKVLGPYIIRYNVIDSDGIKADEATRTVVVTSPPLQPPEKPVIILNGDPHITIEQGDPYTEANATALDKEDGDITNKIVTAGTVDTKVPDTYIISYNVTDSDDNKADEVTRTVVVESPDLPPPEEPVISLLGNQFITIKEEDSYADPGATALDKEDGDITNKIATTGMVDTKVPDTYIIHYNVSDSDGNKADEVTRTVVVESPHLPPPGKPVISLNGDPNITIKKGESYADQGATALDNEDGDITNKIVTSVTDFDINLPGTYFIYYNVSDSDGNRADEVTRTVLVEGEGEGEDGGEDGGEGGGEPGGEPGKVRKPIVLDSNKFHATTLAGYESDPSGARLGYFYLSEPTDNNNGHRFPAINRRESTRVTVEKDGGFLKLTYPSESRLAYLQEAVLFEHQDPDQQPQTTIPRKAFINTVADLSQNAVEEWKSLCAPTASANVLWHMSHNKLALDIRQYLNLPKNSKPDDMANQLIKEDSRKSLFTLMNATNNGVDTNGILGGIFNYLKSGPRWTWDGSKKQEKVDANRVWDQLRLSIHSNEAVILLLKLDTPPEEKAKLATLHNFKARPNKDTTPPLITLQGETPLTHPVGENFEDPGAAAEDDFDGDITNMIVTTGTVDTSKPGDYEITYRVEDQAGNKDSAIRKVQVANNPVKWRIVLKKAPPDWKGEIQFIISLHSSPDGEKYQSNKIEWSVAKANSRQILPVKPNQDGLIKLSEGTFSFSVTGEDDKGRPIKVSAEKTIAVTVR
jgi:hypothetical protein